ncbi:MAG: hypothetical protein WC466_02185 [Candidatus Izemoplasmatales bacterium]
MELNELKKLREMNELDLLYKIIEIAESSKKDMEKTLCGINVAGVRSRKNVQDIKVLCEAIRDKIQERKGTQWKRRKNSALERVIKKTEDIEARDNIKIQKRKQERVSKINNERAKRQ